MWNTQNYEMQTKKDGRGNGGEQGGDDDVR
jgi:hypothetical protein